MPTHKPDPGDDKLIAFYSGTSPDARGRMLADVWAFGIDELENTHDYIQWLFPLYEASRAQPASPVLSPRAAEAIRGSDDMRARVVRSAEVMAFFYGFAIVRQGDAWTVRLAEEFESRKRRWMTLGNHNYLRHTRIMKSLTILGLARLAWAWFECLDDIFVSNQRLIGAETHRYWVNAVRAGA